MSDAFRKELERRERPLLERIEAEQRMWAPFFEVMCSLSKHTRTDDPQEAAMNFNGPGVQVQGTRFVLDSGLSLDQWKVDAEGIRAYPFNIDAVKAVMAVMASRPTCTIFFAANLRDKACEIVEALEASAHKVAKELPLAGVTESAEFEQAKEIIEQEGYALSPLWSGTILNTHCETDASFKGRYWTVDSVEQHFPITPSLLANTINEQADEILVPPDYAPILTALAEGGESELIENGNKLEDWYTDAEGNFLERQGQPRAWATVGIIADEGAEDSRTLEVSTLLPRSGRDIVLFLRSASPIIRVGYSVSEAEDLILFLHRAIEKVCEGESAEDRLVRILARAKEAAKNARSTGNEVRDGEPPVPGGPTEANWEALKAIKLASVWAEKDLRDKGLSPE
jgi:hypothetical protein